MAITIQDIQKQWGVSRATVYKHIKSGKLSRLPDGLVDVAEVLRVLVDVTGGELTNKIIKIQ